MNEEAFNPDEMEDGLEPRNSEPAEPDCEHTYKFVCHSGFQSETYKCTKCGYTMSRRYYEWQRFTFEAPIKRSSSPNLC